MVFQPVSNEALLPERRLFNSLSRTESPTQGHPHPGKPPATPGPSALQGGQGRPLSAQLQREPPAGAQQEMPELCLENRGQQTTAF